MSYTYYLYSLITIKMILTYINTYIYNNLFIVILIYLLLLLCKGHNTSSLFNYIGMCEGQLGHIFPSIEAHKLAIKLDSKVAI